MRKHDIICVVALVMVLLIPQALRAGCGQVPAKPAAEVSPGEYEVFSAYITETFTGPPATERVGSGVSRIVIVNMTQSDENDSLLDENDKPIPWTTLLKYLKKKAPSLKPTTVTAFREANLRQAPLSRSFRLPVEYELVSSAEIDAIFDRDGWWPDYYKKYPDSQGHLTLSRVGFSPDRTQALFYASNHCGGKCGTGSYVVMEKRGSSWTKVKEVVMWIS